MWKAFLIGCRDWENKGKGNFTEHTQYNNIERKNETQVCVNSLAALAALYPL